MANGDANLVHSYRFLRKAIGIIGIALPWVLMIGKSLIWGGGLLGSISGYYYSELRGVFVGSLCAVGVFLLSYRGYATRGDLISTFAGIAAIVVALFPTTPPGNYNGTDQVLAAVHATAATCFFVALALFCLWLFPSHPEKRPGQPPQSNDPRRKIYVTCGVVIVLALVLIAIFGWFAHNRLGPVNPVLWLETIAIFAFGVAWFVRGTTEKQNTGS
ncbi:DUF998 domain-containing protein [Amycolatopsis sp. Hca4]|uniref:DUF998 domain-containing protein n=1 Tax=unclassified Amycolatopsis TaxID=2618356 RepID=UPI0015900F47|nr:DUF998 domain-containing protein [Amycolatopsis sp. Hca4]QKV78289.1 DUF998 domain-containing protein [Amycolatopsis sp. Hca4]